MESDEDDILKVYMREWRKPDCSASNQCGYCRVNRSFSGAPRCVYTQPKEGAHRCEREAQPNSSVCLVHGTSLVDENRRDSLALHQLVPMALKTLKEVVNDTEAKDADRIRAAENILDRAGHQRTVNAMESETARQLLLQRLLELRAAGSPKVVDTLALNPPDVVEAELVDDGTDLL